MTQNTQTRKENILTYIDLTGNKPETFTSIATEVDNSNNISVIYNVINLLHYALTITCYKL